MPRAARPPWLRVFCILLAVAASTAVEVSTGAHAPVVVGDSVEAPDTAPEPTPPGLAQGGAQSSDRGPSGPMKAILDKHNEYRCMHGVPLMKWSDAIADNAAKWAKATGGKMKHSSSSDRKGVGGFSYLGENLAWGATDTYAVQMWYDEIKKTDGGKGLVSKFTSGTGHYTQVVWKTSTSLGCGLFQSLLVCQYGPGGNMGGQFSSHVPAPTKSAAQCKGASGPSPPPSGSGGSGAKPSPPPSGSGGSGAKPSPPPPAPKPRGGNSRRRRRGSTGSRRRKAGSRRRKGKSPAPSGPTGGGGGGSSGKAGTFREFELSYVVRDARRANSAQLAEMTLLSGGKPVPQKPKVRNLGGRSPGHESPPKLVDGNKRSKWLDFNKKPVELYFSKPVKADAVRLTTANDAVERDPGTFTLKGMTSDGKWVVLMKKSGALPTGRHQEVTFPFGAPVPAPSPPKPPPGSNGGSGKPSGGSGKPSGGQASGGGCTKPKSVPKCGKCANSGQCSCGFC